MDHFARLGLPAALDLEPASLDRAYFALQRQWHPDRFVAKPAAERARASTEAAALNDAYRTLKDPLSRAAYLAELTGVETARRRQDDRRSGAADGSHGSARGAARCGIRPRRSMRWRPRSRDDMKASLDGLGSLFLAGDKPAIRKALLRLRYLDKFAEEARARRMNLERSSA